MFDDIQLDRVKENFNRLLNTNKKASKQISDNFAVCFNQQTRS